MTTDTTVADDTSTDETAVHNPTTSTTADHDDAPDTAAELARWKQIARKHEDRAKANADAAKELEKVRAASMTDLERAVAETKSQTRAEVTREFGETRVADLVRVAAAGRQVDVDALLDGINPARFLDDDGQPDTKAIQAWVDRVAPSTEGRTPGVPHVPTGPRGSSNVPASPDQDFAKFITGAMKST